MRNSQDINESSEDFHDEVPLSLNRMTSWGGNINGDMIPPRMLRGYESKLKKIKWECLIIDDGSTDETPVLVKEMTAADNRIKYIHQENSGVSAARNKGNIMVPLLPLFIIMRLKDTVKGVASGPRKPRLKCHSIDF